MKPKFGGKFEREFKRQPAISNKIGPVTFCYSHFSELKNRTMNLTTKPAHLLMVVYIMWRMVKKAQKCPHCKIEGVENA